MKKVLIISLIAMLSIATVFASGSQAKNEEKIYTVAASCDYPPLEYIDENGQIAGYEMDLIKAVAEEMNIKINIVNVSFDGIVAGVQMGQYDIGASGLTITDERKGVVDFTTPVLQFNLAIVTKAGNEAIKCQDDLVGLKVGAQLGSTCQFACEDYGIDVLTYDEAPSAILDLSNGNLDAVVLDDVVANDFVLTNDSYKGVLKVAGHFDSSDDMALAVLKGNSELLSILNEGLDKLAKSGKMQEIKAKNGLN